MSDGDDPIHEVEIHHVRCGKRGMMIRCRRLNESVFRSVACVTLVAAVLLSVGGPGSVGISPVRAGQVTTGAVVGEPPPEAPAAARPVQNTAPLVNSDDEVDMPAVWKALGPEATQFMIHDISLSNLFMEGRAPGSNGNRVAAEYVEFWMKRAGLWPAFPASQDESADSGAWTDPMSWTSYRQPIQPGRGTRFVTRQDMTVDDVKKGSTLALKPWEDFSVLCPGDGEVKAPLTLVGYGIADGPGGYDSFQNVNLKGRVAVVLRFEPSDSAGLSKWNHGKQRWSINADAQQKIKECTQRGAEGVILVNTPHTLDTQANEMMTVMDSPVWSEHVPVVQMSFRAAEELLSAASRGRVTLDDFKARSDTMGAPPVVLSDDCKVHIKVETEMIQLHEGAVNVGGVLRGKGHLKDQWIIIGAHFDHLGYTPAAHWAGLNSPVGATIYPGADDNASGTSGLLILADRLTKSYAVLPDDAEARSILFLAFNGEELGLVGSRYYTRHPTLKADQVNLMLNMDMIGRLRDDKLEVDGINTAKGFADITKPLFEASGLNVSGRPVGGVDLSDHASFFQAGIPVLFFFTGYEPQYHSPGDVATRINPLGAVKVLDLVQKTVMKFATMSDKLESTFPNSVRFPVPLNNVQEPVKAQASQQEKPAAADQAGEAGSKLATNRVRLGVRPNYTDPGPGVLLDGVSPKTCAADAGLKEGDRMMRWNNEDIRGLRGLMDDLARSKPGQVVTISIVRDGKPLDIAVKLRSNNRDQP